jgi:hypothetical protein
MFAMMDLPLKAKYSGGADVFSSAMRMGFLNLYQTKQELYIIDALEKTKAMEIASKTLYW